MRQLPLCSLASLLLLAVPAASHAAEIALRPLTSLKDGDASKRKYGPYVSFFGGSITGQQGNVNMFNANYSLNDTQNGSFYGIEVGKSFKAKKWPLMVNLGFQGSFGSTELEGETDEETLALMPDNGLAAYHTDMNAVMFMVNGSLSLDLYRYRARLGKFISGMRPYVGAGIGGGQLWYRNTTTTSKAQKVAADAAAAAAEAGVPAVLPIPGIPAPAAIGTPALAFPFAVDEFVGAWQWFGGVEYTWKDKYCLFAEYRELHLGDVSEITDYLNKGWSMGFRYRY